MHLARPLKPLAAIVALTLALVACKGSEKSQRRAEAPASKPCPDPAAAASESSAESQRKKRPSKGVRAPKKPVPPTAPTAATPTTPTNPATPTTPATPAANEATPEPDEARVKAARALLDRWTEAQNKGDFKAYSALYAEQFQGVRRSGAATVTLDREGWIKERERMFGKRMKVDADVLTVTIDKPADEPEKTSPGGTANSGATKTPGAAPPIAVSLSQTWLSTTYADTGYKKLTLTGPNDKLRIAGEEMVNSTVLWPVSQSDDPEADPDLGSLDCDAVPEQPGHEVCFAAAGETMGELYVVALVRNQPSGKSELLDIYYNSYESDEVEDEDQQVAVGGECAVEEAGDKRSAAILTMSHSYQHMDSDNDGPWSDSSEENTLEVILLIRGDELMPALELESLDMTGSWSDEVGMTTEKAERTYAFLTEGDYGGDYYDVVVTESEESSTERGHNSSSSETQTHYSFDANSETYEPYEYSE